MTAAKAVLASKELRTLLPRGWEFLQQMVDIDSSSNDAAGLLAVRALIESQWAELGFRADPSSRSARSPLLIADRFTDSSAPVIAILCHMDTVFPPGTAQHRPFAVTENRATGPGVADMKGGIAVAWLAAAAAIQISEGLKNVNLRLVCNSDEEVGSVGSRGAIEAAVRGTDLALVFEPGRPDGSIVTSRRGHRRYRLKTIGKAAHTGVEPWNGVNAIEEVAHLTIAVSGLDGLKNGVSVTVAQVRGGSGINTVPASAEVDVDVRIPEQEAGLAVHKAIEELMSKPVLPGASRVYELTSERPPMVELPQVKGVLDDLEAIATAAGGTLQFVSTGGGSDGAFATSVGVPCVDGLGPSGGGYHTDAEYINVDSVGQRVALLAGYLTAVDERRSIAP